MTAHAQAAPLARADAAFRLRSARGAWPCAGCIKPRGVASCLALGAVLCVGLWSGCSTASSGGQARPPTPESAVQARGTPDPSMAVPVVADARAQALSPACDGQDSQEQDSQDASCDARDQDCDGHIDEGCPYRGGALQVTLAWDVDADLDLYITEPGGETLFFNHEHRRSRAGGEMDQDGRGRCRPEQAQTRVENAYWTGSPPTGEYLAEIHYFSPCGSHGDATATLSVSFKGRMVGTFSYRLRPEERIRALRFTL